MTDGNPSSQITRRTLLTYAAALAGSSAKVLAATSPNRSATGTIALPDAAVIRRDYQRMVDFGPRLPGHPNHVRFVEWLADEFAKTGLQLGPCDEYAYRRWDPMKFGLEVHDGAAVKRVPKVTYFVRSHPTPPEGVSGPLVYGGRITPDGPAALGDIPKGSIVVFDGELRKATIGKLAPELTHVHLKDETREVFLNRPYKRLWLTPAFPLEQAAAKGAAGVVIVMDVSSDMIDGNFSPHANHYKPPLPGLFVGQDAGASLRESAKAHATARLTLSAQWVDCSVPSLTAILPGQSDEAIILNTHTDGQNFIEENGCMTLLQLARHFATLPADQRLRRSVVFVGWPGHMSGGMPEAAGWVRAHPDIVKRAAAAVTVEHLGATEWEDIPGRGYGPTGRNEYMNFAATQGVLSSLVKSGLEKYDLDRHGLEKAPGKTTGVAFHESGVPHVGCVCGPNYLLGIVENGHMDKLDADLAVRQTAMLAELIKQIDAIPAERLRAGDRTLGANPAVGSDTSRSVACIARQPTPSRRPGDQL